MKKYCSTCKFCSDVVNNSVVSCDADCHLKVRPSYKKYMIELEKKNASVNPVTGDRNDRCPAHNYYYGGVSVPVQDVEPAQYVLCAVRNKRFDCKHHVKTVKAPYIKDIFCPHCNLKMDICTDRFHGGFYANEHIYMKPDSCDFICTVDDDGKIVDFDVYHLDYEGSYGTESRQRSRKLGAVVVEVKTRLGFKIDRSDYGWTDGGDYYKKVSKTTKAVPQKRRSFWSWLTTDD